MRTTSRVLVCAALLVLTTAQEMLDECFTCSDKKMKCDLDCVMPKEKTDEEYAWPKATPETEDMYGNCFSLCVEKQSKCSDTDVAVACQSCATDCATTFDGAMVECVQGQDATTTLTYGQDLDACMITAGNAMDDCRTSCSSRDADFFGWTPETEDGTDTTGDTITLPKLREKYQRLKAAGVLPQDKMDGSSGLGTKKVAKAKGILADKKAPH